MHPLLVVFAVAGAAAAFCWVASLVTRDHSWVDRLWSVVPVVYVWIFAGAAGSGDARGSTIFTESITKSKYPEYAEYQPRRRPSCRFPAVGSV